MSSLTFGGTRSSFLVHSHNVRLARAAYPRYREAPPKLPGVGLSRGLDLRTASVPGNGLGVPSAPGKTSMMAHRQTASQPSRAPLSLPKTGNLASQRTSHRRGPGAWVPPPTSKGALAFTHFFSPLRGLTAKPWGARRIAAKRPHERPASFSGCH